jgi:uncharacterized protein (TIGR03085 family)
LRRYHPQVTDIAASERAALADLMQALGPDAPTLCEGWTTRDLAAHLIVRTSRVDAAPGILLPALAGHLRRVQDRVTREPWEAVLAKVRQRPWWLVMGDETINKTEYFVHHEDVRRAQHGWQPRELSAEWSASLWSRVRVQARLVLRRVPAVVTVSAPGFGSVTAGQGGGSAAVELSGHPAELLLFLTGRQAHALIELTGPDQITERMRTARYGI